MKNFTENLIFPLENSMLIRNLKKKINFYKKIWFYRIFKLFFLHFCTKFTKIFDLYKKFFKKVIHLYRKYLIFFYKICINFIYFLLKIF